MPQMTSLPGRTSTWSVLRSHRIIRSRNTLKLYGIRRFDATEYLTNMYKQFLLRDFWNPSGKVRSYQGSKKNATVQDFAWHVTSLTNKALVYRITMHPETKKKQKFDMRKMDAEAPMQILSNWLRRPRWNYLTRIRHPHDHEPGTCRYGTNTITTLHSRNERHHHILSWTEGHLSMKYTIAAFVSLSIIFPLNSPLFHGRFAPLINTHEVNLLSIARRPRWSSRTLTATVDCWKNGHATPNMQHLINASKRPICNRTHNPTQKQPITNAQAMQPFTKT